MEKINVLLLGVGGNVTQGILAVLNIEREKYNIIGACISEESLGLYMCDEAYISPYANDEKFVEWVIKISKERNIDIIFSGVEEVIYELCKNEEKLKKETNAIFISSTLEQLEIGKDKLKTCIWLKENNLNYPKYADGEKKQEIESLIKEVGFPIIAKPKVGKGSIGIYIINTGEELEKILNKEEYIFQEYLGSENEEYTVACYMDRKKTLQDFIVMKRKLKYGTTFMAEIVNDEEIKNEVERICKKFQPVGPLNIQLRKHKGKVVCFELNVRFSGTTPLRARWGYNDVKAMIKEYIFNEDIGKYLQPLSQGKAYRYFNELFIDLSLQKDLEKYGKSLEGKKYNSLEERRMK